MRQESQSVEWACTRCGGSGFTSLPIGLADVGVVCELVRAHSVACAGCPGNARKSLRVRPLDCSEEQWEQVKKKAKALSKGAALAAPSQ
jgi:hypothetical protein